MIKLSFIGTLGADAEFKHSDTAPNGGKFVTFRAAHNDTWTDASGIRHENVTWVDFIMNDHPKVAQYLKKGTMVYVEGRCSLRVYSSPKDRCMKAGMTINVQRIELLSAKKDSNQTQQTQPSQAEQPAQQQETEKDGNDLPF